MLSPHSARLGILFCFYITSIAHAELPSIRFDRVSPLGGSPGESVEIEIVGSDVEDVTTLKFDHPGLSAQHLKERRFRVTIAKDTPAGTYDVRLIGRYGISNPRLFAVSRGVVEVAEKEPNDELATAQPIPINIAVNGTSDSNREDLFRFLLKKGQRVCIECQAGKLDSAMDANMTLSTLEGKQVASNGDYFGRDPFIDFLAPADGDYVVSVHDLSFRGGQPYRLLVTDRPRVENVFPRAVQLGQSTELTVLGRNLGKGAKPSSWRVNDLPLDEMPFAVTPPADLWKWRTFRFVEHPTAHSVLPTASTATVTGFQVQPKCDGFDCDPIPLLVSDTPVTREVEPNDDSSKAQSISLPAVVAGRFDQERDGDWYSFETVEASSYSVEVYCERIGGRADPYVVVLDEKNNRVAELDDFGPRVNAFDGHLRDPSGMVNLGAKQKYRVLVQDRYRRGGARFQYVLTVRKPVPDFYVSVIHHQNPGPGGTTIRRGSTVYLDVILQRKDGFNGPITIAAEGLPKGIHAEPTTIPNDSRGVFVLRADPDAADWNGEIRLIASTSVGGQSLQREVRPCTRVWTEPNMAASRPTRELMIAVREGGPFEVKFANDRIEVEAGKKVEVPVQLVRRQTDFKNAVNLTPLSFPGPMKMPTTEIAADKTEGKVTIEVQANTAPGTYTLTLQCQGQVPFSKDAKATTRPNTLVTMPSRSFHVVVVAAKK